MKGHFVTTFQDWNDANRAQNVLRHGPEQDLKRRRFGRYTQLALASELVVDEADLHDTVDETDLVHDAAMVERLATIAREDDEARLGRRRAEQRDPAGMALMSMSTEVLEREIERLEARIRTYSETRNRLRKEAYDLAPHSLDIIGSSRKDLSS